MAEQITGRPMSYRYVDENRIGDHICYYSDLRKMEAHYPAWTSPAPCRKIFEEIADELERQMPPRGRAAHESPDHGNLRLCRKLHRRALLERPDGQLCGHRQSDAAGLRDQSGAAAKAGVDFFHGDIRAASDFESLPAVDWVIDAAANPSVLAGARGHISSRQLFEHNLPSTGQRAGICKAHKAGCCC